MEHIDTLVNKTFDFEIKVAKKRSFWAKITKKKTEYEIKQFKIQPLTLGVLDLVVSECQDFDVNEDNLNKGGINFLLEGRSLVVKYAKTLSRALAIAIIGENVFYFNGRKLEIKHGEIEKLANLLYISLDFEQLYKICDNITGTKEIANFTNSIRLMMVKI